MALFLGFYLGVILMVVIYNMHWYFLTRDKSYLYYSIFKGLIAVTLIITAQIASFGKIVLIAVVTLLLIALILFTQVLLELKKDFPLIHRILNGFIILLILGYLLTIYCDAYEVYKQPYSLIITPFILIGYLSYRRGNITAKYFVISWALGNSLIGLNDLNQFKVIEFYPEIPFDLIGGILDSILLSYAIHVKTHTLFREKEEQSKMLIHQSKLAASGQMLENISHQWNQPLNRISAFIISMQTHLLSKNTSPEYLSATVKSSQRQLEYMTDTLHDFSNFHRRDTEKETFWVSSVIEHISSIIGQTLVNKNISFDVQMINDFPLHSYSNELSQVLINLVQNAQDELLKRKTENASIEIIIDKNHISVQDNAGGIDEKVVQQMFDAYFTTKGNTSSLGLGLYMCNTILNKYFQTQLELKQTQAHTVFLISFERLLHGKEQAI